MINSPRGDGEGAKACDLRGLGVRSSGKRSSAAVPRGAATFVHLVLAEPGTRIRRWTKGRRGPRRAVTPAARDGASRASPSRRGPRPARSEQGRSPDAPGKRSRGASVLVETVFLTKLPGLARRSAALPELQRLSA